MMRRFSFLEIALVGLATATLSPCLAAAQPESETETYSYAYGHLGFVEGSVSLQRAAETEPEQGQINVPLLPGDRLWTHASSRAEARLADGTILRMSEGAKLDFVELGREQLVRLWSGSLIVEVEESTNQLRIDTPGGSVHPSSAGVYRIDVRGEETVSLSVYQGVAELASLEGSVLVHSGMRSVVSVGQQPDSPFDFNTAQLDAFGKWSASRERRSTRTADIIVKSLPHEVEYYADELSDYGDWDAHDDYGYVWYPTGVSTGWAPYRDGRWGYTPYGYTWISNERWGWAPYHYGRWGFGHRGWYWIPGRTWSAAWVSWSIGPTYVGWSPLGYHNRAVFAYGSAFHYRKDHYYYRGGFGYYGGHKNRGYHGYGKYKNKYYRGGKAVPRHVYDHGSGWSFTDRRGMRGHTAGVRHVNPADVRRHADRATVHSTGAALNRNFTARAVGVDAMEHSRRRTARTYASPGIRTGRLGRSVGSSERAANFQRRSGNTSGLAAASRREAARRANQAGASSSNLASVRRQSASPRATSSGSRFGARSGARSRPSAVTRRGQAAPTPAPARTSPRGATGLRSTTPARARPSSRNRSAGSSTPPAPRPGLVRSGSTPIRSALPGFTGSSSSGGTRGSRGRVRRDTRSRQPTRARARSSSQRSSGRSTISRGSRAPSRATGSRTRGSVGRGASGRGSRASGVSRGSRSSRGSSGGSRGSTAGVRRRN